MDPVERHATLLSTAAEQFTQLRAAVTLGGEYRKLIAMVRELEEAGLEDQAQQLRDSMRTSSGLQALPPPPRPRGRPRKDEGGEA